MALKHMKDFRSFKEGIVLEAIGNRPTLVMIAAHGAGNLVMGNGNALPWPHLQADVDHFTKEIAGKPQLVGFNTYKAGIEQYGKPMPGHQAIVSHQPLPKEWQKYDCSVHASIAEAIDHLTPMGDKIYICGGGMIYKQTLGLADVLDLTVVEGDYPGNVFFPDYLSLVGKEFELARSTPAQGCRFDLYERIS